MGFDTNTDVEALAALEQELRASRPSVAEEIDGSERVPRADLEALAALRSELLAAEAEAESGETASPVIPEVDASANIPSHQHVEDEPVFPVATIPTGESMEGISVIELAELLDVVGEDVRLGARDEARGELGPVEIGRAHV